MHMQGWLFSWSKGHVSLIYNVLNHSKIIKKLMTLRAYYVQFILLKIENTQVTQSSGRNLNSKPQLRSYFWIVNLFADLYDISAVTMLTYAAVLTNCMALIPLSSSLQTDTTYWDQKQWKVCSTCTDSRRTTNIETGDGTSCRALITTLRYRQLATDQFSLEFLQYIKLLIGMIPLLFYFI